MLTLLLLLVGCDTAVPVLFDQCEVDAALSAEAAYPGDLVTIAGGPLTNDRDTLLTVDAEVVDAVVERTDCEVCDACIAEVDCDPCGACTACANLCDACVQTASFTVPALAPGPAAVVLTNAYGSTSALNFEILDDVPD